MKRAFAILALCGTAACAPQAVAPSPTADQVLAAQYRAQGGHGPMSGSESQAVMDSYRRGIAKPTTSSSSTSNLTGEEMRSR